MLDKENNVSLVLSSYYGTPDLVCLPQTKEYALGLFKLWRDSFKGHEIVLNIHLLAKELLSLLLTICKYIVNPIE